MVTSSSNPRFIRSLLEANAKNNKTPLAKLGIAFLHSSDHSFIFLGKYFQPSIKVIIIINTGIQVIKEIAFKAFSPNVGLLVR